MAPPTDRSQILFNFRREIDDGKALVGAGAGIGLSAKSIEAGGGDLIIIYNSGRFRMAGRGSLAGLLPYSNANDVVVEMAPEILSIVEKTPVIAGVCGTDPFKNMPRFLKQLQDMGFAGVQNFPTVGLIDGNFRANLEETGMGFDKEVDMIAEAHKLGLLTTPYVFTPEDATAMAKAGADVLVAHMGLTTSGTIGAKTGRSLDECVTAIQAIEVAAKEVKREIIVLCHGGPIAEPADAQYILDRVVGLHGFFGASSMERLPVEKSIKETMEQFKVVPVPKETNFIKHAVEHLRAREEERN
ncbi:TIM-barrel-protein domain-containing protein [Delphinella strobiligena]|nr:TIM-barrel-protein domain-containing protein [Delphinella strobiligena]